MYYLVMFMAILINLSKKRDMPNVVYKEDSHLMSFWVRVCAVVIGTWKHSIKVPNEPITGRARPLLISLIPLLTNYHNISMNTIMIKVMRELWDFTFCRPSTITYIAHYRKGKTPKKHYRASLTFREMSCHPSLYTIQNMTSSSKWGNCH